MFFKHLQQNKLCVCVFVCVRVYVCIYIDMSSSINISIKIIQNVIYGALKKYFLLTLIQSHTNQFVDVGSISKLYWIHVNDVITKQC